MRAARTTLSRNSLEYGLGAATSFQLGALPSDLRCHLFVQQTLYSKSVCTLSERCSGAGGLMCRCLGRGHGTARFHAAVSVTPTTRAETRAWTRTELGVGAARPAGAYSPRRSPPSGPEHNPRDRRLATIRHGRGVDEALGVAVNALIDVCDELAVEVAVADLIRGRESTSRVTALVAGQTTATGLRPLEIAAIRAQHETRGDSAVRTVATGAGTVSPEAIVNALVHQDLDRAAEEFAVAITDEMIGLGEIAIASGENPGHVWCSVLAALCKGLDQVESYIEDAIKAAIENAIAGVAIIVRPYPQKERTVATRLLDFIIGRTAGHLAKAITKAMATGLGLPHIKMMLRVAAALCCRDPDEHPAVFKYCIWPLIQPVIKDEMASTTVEIIRENVIGGWQGRRPTTRTRGRNYWDLHV
jgi:hypothetical protein